MSLTACKFYVFKWSLFPAPLFIRLRTLPVFFKCFSSPQSTLPSDLPSEPFGHPSFRLFMTEHVLQSHLAESVKPEMKSLFGLNTVAMALGENVGYGFGVMMNSWRHFSSGFVFFIMIALALLAYGTGIGDAQRFGNGER